MRSIALTCTFSIVISAIALPGWAQDSERFVSIGTGGQTGLYHLAGQAICGLLNQGAAEHGMRCNAPASGGGVANVNGLRNGEFDFGLMQADHQYKALNGLPPFEGETAVSDIRALFSLHSEALVLLARRDAGISGFDDLRGKRVNIGNSGSGQRDTLEEILAFKGWDHSAFALATELKPADQPSALGDNDIDVMSYFVGHPNAALEEATLVVDAVLVPLSDADIDRLLAQKRYYSRTEIPGGLYRGNPQATVSLGARAVLSTLASADAEAVYQLVKAVFDSLEALREEHPAFAELQPETMIERGLSAPLHEGAARYYRERGWR